MINIALQHKKQKDSYFDLTTFRLQKKRKIINSTRINNGCCNIDLYILMIQQRLPQQLSYSYIIPKGFPSIFKEWNLDPMTSNKQWVNNDIVRFNFMNLGKGVFDPYRSFIEITVSTNTTSSPVGLLQIDNSAQSFFAQTVLYSNSRQVERITQYSTLAAYLTDMGQNQLISQGRQTQGYGYGSFDTMPYVKSPPASFSTSRFSGTTNGLLTTTSGNLFPTIPNYYPQQDQYQNGEAITNAARIAKGHLSNSNVVLANPDQNGGTHYQGQSCMTASLGLTGLANNIRAQYQAKFVENKFPQTPQSIPNFELQLAQNVSNSVFPFYYNPTVPYTTTVRNQYAGYMYYSQNNSPWLNHTINSANFGFNSFFCPYYTRGTFQPCISATIPQASIFNGKYEVTKLPIYRRKFKIPLISAVIGVLIDPTHFKLIPLASINQCLLEITLDPYAMFTSGYCDISELDNKGMAVMQQRNYVIQRITYKLQTYHFIDNEIQRFIEMSLTKQITIITNFWSLSNQYQIPGGNGVNGSYIVGSNATHLNQLVVLCVPTDWQTYSFARRHFRISNCITKFWSKLAVDYWPPQPYKGNAGNVTSNNIDDDNSVFVENLYWNSDYMFSKAPLPRINAYNFALNERPYNITNKNTFYDASMLGNHNYQFTSNSVNADTAMGMAWLHQNRAVGKAAFVISYTPFKQTQNVLQGINVSGLSNFEVVIESNNNYAFPRDQVLYIFTRCSGVVKYTKEGIKTYGRG